MAIHVNKGPAVRITSMLTNGALITNAGKTVAYLGNESAIDSLNYGLILPPGQSVNWSQDQELWVYAADAEGVTLSIMYGANGVTLPPVLKAEIDGDVTAVIDGPVSVTGTVGIDGEVTANINGPVTVQGDVGLTGPITAEITGDVNIGTIEDITGTVNVAGQVSTLGSSKELYGRFVQVRDLNELIGLITFDLPYGLIDCLGYNSISINIRPPYTATPGTPDVAPLGMAGTIGVVFSSLFTNPEIPYSDRAYHFDVYPGTGSSGSTPGVYTYRCPVKQRYMSFTVRDPATSMWSNPAHGYGDWFIQIVGSTTAVSEPQESFSLPSAVGDWRYFDAGLWIAPVGGDPDLVRVSARATTVSAGEHRIPFPARGGTWSMIGRRVEKIGIVDNSAADSLTTYGTGGNSPGTWKYAYDEDGKTQLQFAVPAFRRKNLYMWWGVNQTGLALDETICVFTRIGD